MKKFSFKEKDSAFIIGIDTKKAKLFGIRKETAEKFFIMLKENDVSPVHLMDVLEDFMLNLVEEIL